MYIYINIVYTHTHSHINISYLKFYVYYTKILNNLYNLELSTEKYLGVNNFETGNPYYYLGMSILRCTVITVLFRESVSE